MPLNAKQAIITLKHQKNVKNNKLLAMKDNFIIQKLVNVLSVALLYLIALNAHLQENIALNAIKEMVVRLL